MSALISKYRHFFQETVWNTPLNSLPKWEAWLYRQIRIWMITFSEYDRDKCSEKASALTYFSLLSIVPVLAMAFGIAQMFGLKEYVIGEMTAYFESYFDLEAAGQEGGQQMILNNLTGWAENMLSRAGGGIISGISGVFLIYAVARLLNNIEVAFNDVWHTPEGRSLKRKVTDYMTMIFLGPIILILSGSVSVFVIKYIQEITAHMEILGSIRPMILFFLNLVPYSLLWFLLFLIYMVFPNTAVKMRPALIAGVMAGTAFQLTQLAWIKGQVYLTSYSDIYGIFAALPLFLIWLQLSWMIVLFGAEFAYAVQNISTWNYVDEEKKLSRKLKKRLLFVILHRVINKFCKEDKPSSFGEISKELFIPNRFIHEIFRDLESAGLISRVKVDADEYGELYQPALDVNKIDIHTVLRKLDLVGMLSLNKLEDNEYYQAVDEALKEIESYGKTSQGNKLLKDL